METISRFLYISYSSFFNYSLKKAFTHSYGALCSPTFSRLFLPSAVSLHTPAFHIYLTSKGR